MEKKTVYEIIGSWPRRSDLADDLSSITEQPVDVSMIHKWAKNGVIPAWWQDGVLESARMRQINLSADELVRAHSIQETKKGVSA